MILYSLYLDKRRAVCVMCRESRQRGLGGGVECVSVSTGVNSIDTVAVCQTPCMTLISGIITRPMSTCSVHSAAFALLLDKYNKYLYSA